jgi:hypothetical protein
MSNIDNVPLARSLGSRLGSFEREFDFLRDFARKQESVTTA